MDPDAVAAIVTLVLGLVVGLVLSFAVGLAPALIYRYAIYKKPVPKKKVFWRLAPAVFVLMFVFKLTMAGLTDSEPNPNPIPWVIIYFVGRWIMIRKSKRRTDTVDLADQEEPLIVGTKCPRCGHQLPEPDWRCPKCYFEFEDEKSESESGSRE